jgi:hypothetical protein
MRTFAYILFAATFLGSVDFVSAGDVQVRAVRDKREVGIAHPERVAMKLIAIAESSSVNSTAYAVSDKTWARILDSDSFVHAVFPTPRRMRLQDRNSQDRKEWMVGEVLFPLPVDSDPLHIYLKTEKEIISLTKYDPYALRELALEDDLRPRGVPRYDFLFNLPSKR